MSSATAVVPASTAADEFDDDDELVENTQWIDKRLNNLSAEESDTLKRIEQTASAPSQQTLSERKMPTESVPPPPLLPALKHECSNLLCKTQPLPQKLSVCARCRQAQYCSKECQSQDWKKNHKQECTKLLEKVMSAPAMAPIVTAEPDIPISAIATTESSSSSSSSSKHAENEKSARRRELLAQSKARITAKKSRDDQRRKITTSGHSVPDLSSLMSGIQDTMRTMKSGEESNDSKKEAFLKQTDSITSMLAKVMPTQQKQLTSIVNKLHGNMTEPSTTPKPKKDKKKKKPAAVAQEASDPSANSVSSMELPPDE